MLTVIGEGLVDVVQRASGIEAHVGGSPLNVAVGLARLDHPVQFIGRYGRDAYG
ncbi:MAG TPA: carbohydrate kinase, partial [Arthrobacter bacterium]|nr:carbohydrate kinase [Arthrobacter sp.]